MNIYIYHTDLGCQGKLDETWLIHPVEATLVLLTTQLTIDISLLHYMLGMPDVLP